VKKILKRHPKKTSDYLNKIDLPKEIKDGIRSRASMLESTLKTISQEDLIQEGLLLVYSILANKPDATLPYLMEAVNHHFTDIQDYEIDKNNFSSPLYSEDIERELDKIAYQHSQRRPKTKKASKRILEPFLSGIARGQVEPIVIMHNEGITFKDIAAYLGKNQKTIRRILKQYGKEIYGENQV
jgi:DNA-directed RNA polymerase specialized sigma24 family protein